jgi:hypothetical protein
VGAPVVAAYAAGQMFYFVATGDNTGAVTLNIDSLGAKAVTRDGSVALAAGDIKSGEVVVVVYDGTRFQVVSQLNSAGDARFANVSIASSLYVGGVSTFVGNAGFSANVSIASALSVGGVAAITGATTIGGNLTLNGGTANGVLYLNGSKVATSGSALTFTGSVLGVNNSGDSDFKLTTTNTGSGSTDGLLLRINSTGSEAYLWNWEPSSVLIFGANAAEQMRLTSTGLGIGTSSPGQKLEVAGNIFVNTSGNPYAEIKTSGAGNNPSLKLTADTNSWTFQGTFSNANDDLLVLYNATTLLDLTKDGNLGLGVTPSAWNSAWKAIQAGNGAAFQGQNNSVSVVHVSGNAYIDSGGVYRYIGAEAAQRYRGFDGAHEWYTAPSGTAGNAISFTQAMTLSSTADRGTLNINGNTQALFELSHAGTRKSYLYQIGTELQIFNEVSGIMAFGTNGTERARITSGGDLLVGATATVQSSRAEFTSTSLAPAFLARVNANSDEGQWAGQFQKKTNTSTTSQIFVRFLINDGATASGYITANGANAATFTSSSDARLKENIVDLPPQLSNILALKPVEFDYKDGSGHQIGFIAQDLQEVYPDCVSEGTDGMLQIGGWSKTEARLVKALQEAMARIESLEAKVTALESK